MEAVGREAGVGGRGAEYPLCPINQGGGIFEPLAKDARSRESSRYAYIQPFWS